jgi:uncharacterized protein (DUF1778 family)
MTMPTLTRRHSIAPPTEPATESRTARLEARIPATLKGILLEAAGLTGHPSVTSYVIRTLQESAARTVEQARLAHLDEAASTAFVQSLLAPSEPVPALQAAFARSREQGH